MLLKKQNNFVLRSMLKLRELLARADVMLLCVQSFYSATGSEMAKINGEVCARIPLSEDDLWIHLVFKNAVSL